MRKGNRESDACLLTWNSVSHQPGLAVMLSVTGTHGDVHLKAQITLWRRRISKTPKKQPAKPERLTQHALACGTVMHQEPRTIAS